MPLLLQPAKYLRRYSGLAGRRNALALRRPTLPIQISPPPFPSLSPLFQSPTHGKFIPLSNPSFLSPRPPKNSLTNSLKPPLSLSKWPRPPPRNPQRPPRRLDPERRCVIYVIYVLPPSSLPPPSTSTNPTPAPHSTPNRKNALSHTLRTSTRC